jgi:hypothetical protein
MSGQAVGGSAPAETPGDEPERVAREFDQAIKRVVEVMKKLEGVGSDLRRHLKSPGTLPPDAKLPMEEAERDMARIVDTLSSSKESIEHAKDLHRDSRVAIAKGLAPSIAYGLKESERRGIKFTILITAASIVIGTILSFGVERLLPARERPQAPAAPPDTNARPAPALPDAVGHAADGAKSAEALWAEYDRLHGAGGAEKPDATFLDQKFTEAVAAARRNQDKTLAARLAVELNKARAQMGALPRDLDTLRFRLRVEFVDFQVRHIESPWSDLADRAEQEGIKNARFDIADGYCMLASAAAIFSNDAPRARRLLGKVRSRSIGVLIVRPILDGAENADAAGEGRALETLIARRELIASCPIAVVNGGSANGKMTEDVVNGLSETAVKQLDSYKIGQSMRLPINLLQTLIFTFDDRCKPIAAELAGMSKVLGARPELLPGSAVNGRLTRPALDRLHQAIAVEKDGAVVVILGDEARNRLVALRKRSPAE